MSYPRTIRACVQAMSRMTSRPLPEAVSARLCFWRNALLMILCLTCLMGVGSEYVRLLEQRRDEFRHRQAVANQEIRQTVLSMRAAHAAGEDHSRYLQRSLSESASES